jgi:hypothetical protein
MSDGIIITVPGFSPDTAGYESCILHSDKPAFLMEESLCGTYTYAPASDPGADTGDVLLKTVTHSYGRTVAGFCYVTFDNTNYRMMDLNFFQDISLFPLYFLYQRFYCRIDSSALKIYYRCDAEGTGDSSNLRVNISGMSFVFRYYISARNGK